MIWKVLSNRANLPAGWVSTFTVSGMKNYAVKTGTTDKKEKDESGNEVILPRDGWIAAYTPSKVAIFW
jgi:membrane peptidoglycan carboxypeptidase